MRKLRDRMGGENGFSLIELSLVILINGILAAIALPAFLGPQMKGQDADAKSNARNVVAAVQSCHAETRAYSSCDTLAELESAGAKVGVELTDSAAKKKGAVSVTGSGDSYTVVGYSHSGSTFTVAVADDGSSSRSCTAAADGACNTGTW